jgi:DNA-binding SARP family transcriptional activator
MTKLFLRTLGVPQLEDGDGKPVVLKTRKALAVLGYLVRCPGGTETRNELSSLLWSDGDRMRAAVSLRQALSHIRQAERETGLQLVIATPAALSIVRENIRTDVDGLAQGISMAGPGELERIISFWAGDFLYGFDTLDPAFSEWLAVEQMRVRSVLSKKITEVLVESRSDIGLLACNKRERLARFLLTLDPANEYGHQELIRHFLRLGQKERAQQQLRDCTRELRNLLDIEPSAETRRLLDEGEEFPSSGVAEAKASGGGVVLFPGGRQASAAASASLTGGDQGQSRRHSADADGDDAGGAAKDQRDVADRHGFRLPVISIASMAWDEAAGDEMAMALREEIVAGLSAYRSFDLYEAAYWGGESGMAPARVDGGELGSFMLRFHRDRTLHRLGIQLENRTSGQIAFHELIDLELVKSVSELHEAVYRTVSRIHSHIIGRLRQRPGRSPFGRWCQVESLIWEFNAAADRKALAIMKELQDSDPTFSLTYAGQASILMKQALFYPTSEAQIADAEHVLSLTEQAVALDPWQVVNHRVNGWALIRSRRPEDARRAFMQALKLNPLDPMNAISVAEALAYIGERDKALSTAEKGFDGLIVTPRIVYGYLANVFFALGDYEKSADYARRGPFDNLHGLATRFAALWRAGHSQDAEAARTLLLQCMERQLGASSRWHSSVQLRQWLDEVNLFQEPEARASFDIAMNSLRETVGIARRA